MVAHPSTLAAFAPLSPGMTRAVRRQRLARTCRHLGATPAQVAQCRDTGELWQLRTRLLEELMDAPASDGAA